VTDTILFRYILAGFISCAAGAITYLIIFWIRTSASSRLKQAILRQSDFTPDMIYIEKMGWGMPGIAFDTKRRKVLFAYRHKLLLLDLAEIPDVHIDIDDYFVENAGLAGQFFGAAVGGAIAGRTGALIGGLSASTKIKQKIRHIDLVLNTTNPERPIHRVRFYQSFLMFYGAISEPKIQKAIDDVCEWGLALLQMTLDKTEVVEAEVQSQKFRSQEGLIVNDTSAAIRSTINTYFTKLGRGKSEIYNEFSLQHELGIEIRNSLGASRPLSNSPSPPDTSISRFANRRLGSENTVCAVPKYMLPGPSMSCLAAC